MIEYKHPSFDFGAPLKLVQRMEENETGKHPYRSDFMRDRDRIMYCSAFRRLAGKTQIYLTGKNDHQRNRLTHTLEVSQIARTVSWALGLDCDLTEAIALGHDLGHTPFGHAGEQTLHELMVPNSKNIIENSPMNDASVATNETTMPFLGFKHNVQSVHVATTLERGYGKAGLNLTNFTLWGILHHSSLEYKKDRVSTSITNPMYRIRYAPHMYLTNGEAREAWSFEAFVVAQADEIAQWHHDLEDALRGNAMTCGDVCNTIQKMLKPIMAEEDLKKLNNLKKRTQINRKYVADLSRIVVNTLVSRLVECSLHNLEILWNEHVKEKDNKADFFIKNNWNDPQIAGAIGFSKFGEHNKNVDFFQNEYPSIISEKIHHSREVERMNLKGKYIIKKLFQAYYSHPQQLPDSTIIYYMIDMGLYLDWTNAMKVGIGAVRKKFEAFVSNDTQFTLTARLALMRAVCDHIAGMTDHYAIEEYQSLYG